MGVPFQALCQAVRKLNDTNTKLNDKNNYTKPGIRVKR